MAILGLRQDYSIVSSSWTFWVTAKKNWRYPIGCWNKLEPKFKARAHHGIKISFFAEFVSIATWKWVCRQTSVTLRSLKSFLQWCYGREEAFSVETLTEVKSLICNPRWMHDSVCAGCGLGALRLAASSGVGCRRRILIRPHINAHVKGYGSDDGI